VSTRPTPNLAEADKFLHLLDPKDVFTFQTFDDDKRRKDPRLAHVFHGTLAQNADTLVDLQRRGAGVFVMTNRGDGVIHPGAKTCRATASVVAVRSLFADLDGAPLEPVLAALQPDIVVESSPDRWHCYWLTDDCPLDEFKACQQRIAAKLGSDPKVHDLPRVMRLPGFLHQKGEPFLTHVTYPE
jgi:hypothetical protein